jgi:hypothetical protein
MRQVPLPEARHDRPTNRIVLNADHQTSTGVRDKAPLVLDAASETVGDFLEALHLRPI